jgi:hypothetical protein
VVSTLRTTGTSTTARNDRHARPFRLLRRRGVGVVAALVALVDAPHAGNGRALEREWRRVASWAVAGVDARRSHAAPGTLVFTRRLGRRDSRCSSCASVIARPRRRQRHAANRRRRCPAHDGRRRPRRTFAARRRTEDQAVANSAWPPGTASPSHCASTTSRAKALTPWPLALGWCVAIGSALPALRGRYVDASAQVASTDPVARRRLGARAHLHRHPGHPALARRLAPPRRCFTRSRCRVSCRSASPRAPQRRVARRPDLGAPDHGAGHRRDRGRRLPLGGARASTRRRRRTRTATSCGGRWPRPRSPRSPNWPFAADSRASPPASRTARARHPTRSFAPSAPA